MMTCIQSYTYICILLMWLTPTFLVPCHCRSCGSTEINTKRWLVPSKPHERALVARPRESNWQLRLPERVPQLLGVSRSPTDIAPELWLFVRSGDIKRALSSLFANSHSSALSVRLPRILRPTSDSRDLLSLPCRRLPRHTWLVCLRIRTCVPSMPRGSPSCPKIFSWHDASVGSDPNSFRMT